MSPTVSRVAALLGTMGIGSPYLPIDPNFPDSRIVSMMESAAADRVIVDEFTAKRFASMAPEFPYALIDVSAYSSLDSEDAEGGPAVIEPSSSDLAYIIYTSGSTGNPKGVAIEHGGLSHLLDALDRELPAPRDQAAESWLAAGNLCFDLSVVELFWPLSRGIPLVVASMESLAGRSEEGTEFLAGVLTSGTVTHFFTTPSLVRLMMRDPVLAAAIRGLHVLILGGETLRPELVARLRPVPHVYNAYGPTEATVCTTIHRCSDEDVEHVPIGHPLHGVDVRVVDEEGRDCPPGVFGELLIAGPGLARGYVNDEELTARKFPVLFDGERRRRWYRTGDVVSIDADSTVSYRGRVDGQVKVRGFRVELGEIEAAIRAVPGVEEAAVLPVREDQGGGVTGLTAWAKSEEPGVSEDAIIAEIVRVLPWYAIPHAVRVLPELPVAGTGKLDRKALERRLAELPSIPPRPGTESGDPSRAPGEGYERSVAETWASVLGVATPIDAEQNFFDAGGNSALSGLVFSRLRQAFPEAKLRLIDVYRYPTVSAMAARLRAGPPAAHGALAPPEPTARGTSRPGESRRPPLSAAERRRRARRVK